MQYLFLHTRFYIFFIIFLLLTGIASAQFPGGNLYELKGSICIDTDAQEVSFIRVIIGQTHFRVFKAGTEAKINTRVPEIPVRVSIYQILPGRPNVLIGHFWIETSDPFIISGNKPHRDSIISLPQNDLSIFEAELAQTLKPEMQLRLIAANSNHEAGLYHLWQRRHQYNHSELDYMLRRTNFTAKAFSLYSLLRAFHKADTSRGFLFDGPFEKLILPGADNKTHELPSSVHAYTLLYVPVPGSENTRAAFGVLKEVAQTYEGHIKVVAILYPTLQAPISTIVKSSKERADKPFEGMYPLIAYEPNAWWTQVFDYSGISLIHFRVKLIAPLSNGFEYGLNPPYRNPTYQNVNPTRKGKEFLRGGNQLLFQENLVSNMFFDYNETGSIQAPSSASMQATLFQPNKPVFLLLSRDGLIVKKWQGYPKQGAILAAIKKVDTKEEKARLRTRPI